MTVMFHTSFRASNNLRSIRLALSEKCLQTLIIMALAFDHSIWIIVTAFIALTVLATHSFGMIPDTDKET